MSRTSSTGPAQAAIQARPYDPNDPPRFNEWVFVGDATAGESDAPQPSAPKQTESNARGRAGQKSNGHLRLGVFVAVVFLGGVGAGSLLSGHSASPAPAGSQVPQKKSQPQPPIKNSKKGVNPKAAAPGVQKPAGMSLDQIGAHLSGEDGTQDRKPRLLPQAGEKKAKPDATGKDGDAQRHYGGPTE